MRVHLKVVGGKNADKEIPLKEGVFLIGRGEGCHLRPRSDLISRKHCRIKITPDGLVTIKDLKSRNGVLVNGKKIETMVSRKLKLGDHLQIGKIELEVLIDHSIGGAKRDKVKDVKDVAARQASKPSDADDDDVSAWLSEADETDLSLRFADPETRQFKIAETDTINDMPTMGAGAPDADTSEEKPKSKEKGKLPPQQNQTESSKHAAEDTLRKLFSRR
ncbi:MAG: FHA domain-containing protein [bacterium]|nr:FHA domain-containing protein [bacterium]